MSKLSHLSSALVVMAVLLGCEEAAPTLRDAGSEQDSGVERGVQVGSCHAFCDAQDAVTGCAPAVSGAQCKALCDGVASGTPTACEDEWEAYYACAASAPIECIGPVQVLAGGACATQEMALTLCQNEGEGGACEGALKDGRCPSFDCVCPEGVQRNVSAVDYDADNRCFCLDASNCHELICE